MRGAALPGRGPLMPRFGMTRADLSDAGGEAHLGEMASLCKQRSLLAQDLLESKRASRARRGPLPGPSAALQAEQACWRRARLLGRGSAAPGTEGLEGTVPLGAPVASQLPGAGGEPPPRDRDRDRDVQQSWNSPLPAPRGCVARDGGVSMETGSASLPACLRWAGCNRRCRP